MHQTVIGDDGLALRAAFQAALGGVSRSTFSRWQRTGLLPRPDAWLGQQQAWKISTIRSAVAKLVAAGDAARPPEKEFTRPRGRPRKVRADAPVVQP